MKTIIAIIIIGAGLSGCVNPGYQALAMCQSLPKTAGYVYDMTVAAATPIPGTANKPNKISERLPDNWDQQVAQWAIADGWTGPDSLFTPDSEPYQDIVINRLIGESKKDALFDAMIQCTNLAYSYIQAPVRAHRLRFKTYRIGNTTYIDQY